MRVKVLWAWIARGRTLRYGTIEEYVRRTSNNEQHVTSSQLAAGSSLSIAEAAILGHSTRIDEAVRAAVHSKGPASAARDIREILASTADATIRIRLTERIIPIYRDLRHFQAILKCWADIESLEISLPFSSSRRVKLYENVANALARTGQRGAAIQLLEQKLAKEPNTSLIMSIAQLLVPSNPDQARALFAIDPLKLTEEQFALYVYLLINCGSVEQAETIFLDRYIPGAKSNGEHLMTAYLIAAANGDNELARLICQSYWKHYNLIFADFSFARTDFSDLGSHQESSTGPLVSVIMTTYNSACTLSFSVASVLRQTYSNIELIIVDDASTDAVTLNLIQSWAAKDPRVRWHRLDANSGTYVAKNWALENARGEYITFHDSDDWAHPQRLATQVSQLMATPRLVANQSSWIRVNQKGEPLLKSWGRFLHTNPAAVMLRRSVIDHMGLFDQVRIGADTEYINRLKLLYGPHRFSALKIPLSLGLHRDDGLTNSGAGKIHADGSSPSRLAYWAAWAEWHIETVSADGSSTYKIDRSEFDPFPIPDEIRST